MRMTMTLLLTALLVGCTINLPSSVEARAVDELAELEEVTADEEAEVLFFYEEFYATPVDEQREFCWAFEQVPVSASFEAYIDIFGDTVLSFAEFEIMIEVACEDVALPST